MSFFERFREFFMPLDLQSRSSHGWPGIEPWKHRPVLLLLFLQALLGCSPESKQNLGKIESSSNPSVSPSVGSEQPTTPKQQAQPAPMVDPKATDDTQRLLTDCLKKYRSITRYQDLGQLVIQSDSKMTIPMQVAWEKPNRLGLRTGALQGSWTSTTWEAQSLGAVNPFPNQRLVRPLPGTINLDWINDDTMGGLLLNPMSKPIQLDLLLSSDLSDSLVGSDAILKTIESSVFDGAMCQRVSIEKTIASQTFHWVLWIDAQTSLIRKIELPSQFFYPNLPADQLQDVSCAVELLGATAETPIDWSRWSVPNIPQEVSVSRWVAPPPIASTPILGNIIEPLDLKDANDAVLLDTAEPRKPLSILIWISDRNESKALIDDLISVQRVLLDKELSPSCNIYLVSSDKESVGLAEKLKSWNCDLPLAVDRDGKLSGAFQIHSAPAMVILDRARRVQVAELVIMPQTIASIPELIFKLRGQQDLASRQLQQDLDNQSRFIGGLHRVALDKDQVAKLPEIIAFPFGIVGMRRDWKVELESSLVSATGLWTQAAALEASTGGSLSQMAMVTLDEDGRLHRFAWDGTKQHFAQIEPQQADGAKRLLTSIDPWTQSFVAVVPEGLPRFWIAPTENANPSPRLATAYNTQAAESPVCHTWIPQRFSDNQTWTSKLAIGTSESRLMMIDPSSEQRLDGTFREPPVTFVPGIDSKGQIDQWDVLYPDGSLHKISNLTSAKVEDGSGGALEARLDQLTAKALGGNWFWGSHKNAKVSAGSAIPIELFLGKLPSGETGVYAANHLHQILASRAITVRGEQARLWGAAQLKDGTLLGLATGPSRILHLFSADLSLQDQASFGARVFGAGLMGWQGDLKIIVALEKEVSCWSIDIPDMMPNP